MTSLGVRLPSAYVPLTADRPSPKQTAALLLDDLGVLEVLYGGAAGGGKSDWLLMGALRFVHVPGYNAILFRKTYADLVKPGALVPRSQEWLGRARRRGLVRWNSGEKKWTFVESGATLSFGYMERDDQRFNYDGTDYQYVGFDEVAHFTEVCYRYLFRSLRKPEQGPLADVPLRYRAACNPIGPGLDWVKTRFGIEQDPESGQWRASKTALRAGRIFIPARVEDNPGLDRRTYERSLSELDPVTRARLLEGRWDARESGGYFRREWFRIVERGAPIKSRRLRYWDEGGVEPTSANPDPDWTVGLLLAEYDGSFWIEDVVRFRKRSNEADRIMRATAELDGHNVEIVSEQEPGSSGVKRRDHLRQVVFNGYRYRADKKDVDKESRAKTVSSRVEAGDVQIVRGEWNHAFLDEVEPYPETSHDDQVDGLSGAYAALSGRKTIRLT